MDESEVDSCQLITNLIPAENEVLLVIYPEIGTSEVTKTARSGNGSGKRTVTVLVAPLFSFAVCVINGELAHRRFV
jgi:hypothetical protein